MSYGYVCETLMPLMLSGIEQCALNVSRYMMDSLGQTMYLNNDIRITCLKSINEVFNCEYHRSSLLMTLLENVEIFLM